MNHNKTKRKASSRTFEKQFPILRKFRVRPLVFVHCPWCDRRHVHRWDRNDRSRVITLRVVHGGHEPPAPPSYRVGVFGEQDLRRIADRAVRNLVVDCG